MITNPVVCPTCGHDLELSEPIRLDRYVGMKASPCSICKTESGIFQVVPFGKDTILFWQNIKKEIDQNNDH